MTATRPRRRRVDVRTGRPFDPGTRAGAYHHPSLAGLGSLGWLAGVVRTLEGLGWTTAEAQAWAAKLGGTFVDQSGYYSGTGPYGIPKGDFIQMPSGYTIDPGVIENALRAGLSWSQELQSIADGEAAAIATKEQHINLTDGFTVTAPIVTTDANLPKSTLVYDAASGTAIGADPTKTVVNAPPPGYVSPYTVPTGYTPLVIAKPASSTTTTTTKTASSSTTTPPPSSSNTTGTQTTVTHTAGEEFELMNTANEVVGSAVQSAINFLPESIRQTATDTWTKAQAIAPSWLWLAVAGYLVYHQMHQRKGRR